MDKYKKQIAILCLVMLTGCGSQDWRLGNQYSDMKVTKKREAERDRRMNRALDYQKNTAKYYIKEYKSHDGKLNIFRRDGFDR